MKKLQHKKKVTLKLHLEEGVTIRVNREQIAQLVSILTENAAKYVNDGGKIVWRLTKTQHGAVLVVKKYYRKKSFRTLSGCLIDFIAVTVPDLPKPEGRVLVCPLQKNRR